MTICPYAISWRVSSESTFAATNDKKKCTQVVTSLITCEFEAWEWVAPHPASIRRRRSAILSGSISLKSMYPPARIVPTTLPGIAGRADESTKGGVFDDVLEV